MGHGVEKCVLGRERYRFLGVLSLRWPLDTQVAMSGWQLEMGRHRWPGDEVGIWGLLSG